MSLTARTSNKAKRRNALYNIVLVPRWSSGDKGEVIGTVEGSLLEPKVLWVDAEAFGLKLDSDKISRLAKALGAARRHAPPTKVRRKARELFESEVQADTTSEDEAVSLLGDVAETMAKLAKAQSEFRAELAAAHDEGEKLFKRAAG
jgi:hypothetical protein